VSPPIPTKFSEALQLALDDLAKAEASPDYRVLMAVWHTERDFFHKCEVCFAGSVMAFSLGANPEQSYNPFEFGDWRPVLFALNNLRQGCVSLAQEDWPEGFQPTDPLMLARDLNRVVGLYRSDREAWRAEMENLLFDLQKAGT
jgi:hypothetical protein